MKTSIIKGKYNPFLKLAYDIAKVLGSKVEDVFIFENEENQTAHVVHTSGSGEEILEADHLVCFLLTQKSTDEFI